ncbi:DUF3306 domain-containing protein [Pseudoprimorskyibacter insulae]|uniref:DUF3306 domain-containing protein n=1 Tax=Pseudoprimorskyibacter insulae TaxID=1695997 RepID=A0A2R8B068_9RHOB|nr:DUF3306 domain-containing protein [Pseudoprimorskyibacter insulae]SPF81682.1 hypothetical protein PRI8871_03507 [Pseudoprimorskyibacter insulae]
MSDFWSRRKAAVEQEARAEEDAQAAAVVAAEQAALEERTDEDILEELGLPDPDVMETPDQVRSLLAATVPQRLKTRALRRLWRLNPTLANLDGLVDYGGDFTDSANVIENLQTAYQVGKGMASRIQEMVEAAAQEAEDKEAKAEPEAPQTVAAEPEAAPQIAPAPAPAPEFTPEPEDAPVLAASSRRMRFRFDHAT